MSSAAAPIPTTNESTASGDGAKPVSVNPKIMRDVRLAANPTSVAFTRQRSGDGHEPVPLDVHSLGPGPGTRPDHGVRGTLQEGRSFSTAGSKPAIAL